MIPFDPRAFGYLGGSGGGGPHLLRPTLDSTDPLTFESEFEPTFAPLSLPAPVAGAAPAPMVPLTVSATAPVAAAATGSGLLVLLILAAIIFL